MCTIRNNRQNGVNIWKTARITVFFCLCKRTFRSIFRFGDKSNSSGHHHLSASISKLFAKKSPLTFLFLQPAAVAGVERFIGNASLLLLLLRSSGAFYYIHDKALRVKLTACCDLFLKKWHFNFYLNLSTSRATRE